MTPALVVLAAGASARLGECKALVDLGGRSPLERLLAAGGGACRTPALVVAGRHAAEIEAALARAPRGGVELLVNPGFAAGRLGSVAAAVRARPGQDLLLAPVDVPLVRRETFEGLVDEWRRAGRPADGWLAPRCGGRYGHPVVLGRALAAACLGEPPSLPLRDVRAKAGVLLALDVDDPGVLDDLDGPADLAALRARLRGRDAAT